MQSTLLLAVILTKISYAFVASLLCFFSSFLSDIVQSYGSDKMLLSNARLNLVSKCFLPFACSTVALKGMTLYSVV